MKGSRIHGIVRELRNENIDVINFTNNTQLFIQRALSPAKVTSMTLNEETGRADVFLKPDQVSMAIGKEATTLGWQVALRDMKLMYTEMKQLTKMLS